eukprot:gene7583-9324_t
MNRNNNNSNNNVNNINENTPLMNDNNSSSSPSTMLSSRQKLVSSTTSVSSSSSSSLGSTSSTSSLIISPTHNAHNSSTCFTDTDAHSDNSIGYISSAMKSRDYLLYVHNGTISQLNFAILVSNPIGSWSLATYNGDVLSNATQCVYLPFLVAGVNWCLNQNKDPHCLQMEAGPMMDDFSSIYAGILFDTITGAPNSQFTDQNDPNFLQWMKKRSYVETFLSSYNLLGNQSIMNKVYPSNSGPIPTWGEQIVVNVSGPNYMDPYDSAMLMLYATHGGVVAEGQSYMTDLIARQTFSQYTSLGFGLPPGTVLHSVLGTSSTDINEVAHMILPNGKEIIISAFSDGYQNFGYPPYQSSILGMFAENLLDNLNLTIGNPAKIVLTTQSIDSVEVVGPWKLGTGVQAFNSTYLYMKGGVTPMGTITWSIDIEFTGLYEVCVWFPAGTNHSTAIYVVAPGDQPDLVYEYTISQVHYGARWILLDSFYFVKGNKPTIAISTAGTPTNSYVVADAIKLTQWPSNLI